MKRLLVRVALRGMVSRTERAGMPLKTRLLQFRQRWIGGGEWESFYHKALIIGNLFIFQFTTMPRIQEISSYRYVLGTWSRTGP